MKELLNNKVVKIIGLVLLVIIISRLIGYLFLGTVIVGVGYYFYKKKGGDLVVFEEQETELSSDPFSQDLQDAINKIKKTRDQ